MTDFSPEERAFLELAGGGDNPSANARARMRSNVFAQVGLGAAAAAATAAAATAASAAPAGAKAAAAGAAAGGAMTKVVASAGLTTAKVTALKLLAGVAVLTAVGGAGYLIRSGRAEQRAATEARSSIASVVQRTATEAVAAATSAPPPSESAPAAPPDESDDVEFERAPSGQAHGQAASSAPELQGELGLLRSAQQKLGKGDAKKALEMLDAHKRRYGQGSLGEERMAVRVFALCDLGRVAEARAEAQRFLATAPQSPLASRVARACADKP